MDTIINNKVVIKLIIVAIATCAIYIAIVIELIALHQREKTLAKQEQDLKQQEQALAEQKKDLNQREQAFVKNQKQALKQEQDLKQQEQALAEQKKDFVKQVFIEQQNKLFIIQHSKRYKFLADLRDKHELFEMDSKVIYTTYVDSLRQLRKFTEKEAIKQASESRSIVDIESKLYHNRAEYKEYLIELKNIPDYISISGIDNLDIEDMHRLEDELCSELIIDKPIDDVSVEIEVTYLSTAGRNKQTLKFETSIVNIRNSRVNTVNIKNNVKHYENNKIYINDEFNF